MKILHKEGSDGEFYIREDGERLAQLQYFHSRPGEINIHHTEVDDKLSGRGIGKQLVAAAVDYARKNDLRLMASCPFAKKIIEKTPEFQDVLATS
jgi:predicted GNAT family acetyltransferase